jgi:hypothetical protein
MHRTPGLRCRKERQRPFSYFAIPASAAVGLGMWASLLCPFVPHRGPGIAGVSLKVIADGLAFSGDSDLVGCLRVGPEGQVRPQVLFLRSSEQ